MWAYHPPINHDLKPSIPSLYTSLTTTMVYLLQGFLVLIADYVGFQKTGIWTSLRHLIAEIEQKTGNRNHLLRQPWTPEPLHVSAVRTLHIPKIGSISLVQVLDVLLFNK